MCESMKLKVLTVDKDEYSRYFYRKVMIKNGYLVTEAANGRDGVSIATSICPDIVLLDMDLPDMDGLLVIEKLRGWSDCIILVVTEKKEMGCKIKAFDAGADDYIIKPYNTDEFMARMRSVLRRRNSANIMQPYQANGLMIDYEKRKVLLAGRAIHLSPVEYRILEYLSMNSGKVVTYKMIMEKIWGPYSSDNKILRVNMTHIRNKIEKNSALPEYIITEARVGYRMLDNQYQMIQNREHWL